MLLDVSPGTNYNIIKKINAIDNVKEVDVVRGSHDIVVVIEGDYETVDKTILQIRKIPKILKSESLLSLKPP